MFSRGVASVVFDIHLVTLWRKVFPELFIKYNGVKMEKERASFDSLLYNKTPPKQIQDPIFRVTLPAGVDVGFSGSPVWGSQSYGLGNRYSEALGLVLGISRYQLADLFRALFGGRPFISI